MGAQAGGNSQRAVLITGCGSGIGAETARWLNARGYFVLATVRREPQGQALRTQVDYPDQLQPLVMDVTDQRQIDEARRQAAHLLAERRATLIGIVNNAADENLGPVEILPLEVFRREIEVGYLGAVAVTKAYLSLLRNGSGRVVNISSVNGRCTFKYHATTCATKYALEAFSDALRMELKPWKMHVAIIEPGPTNTPLMGDKTIHEFSHKLAAFPREELEAYFPDFEETVKNVSVFVKKIQEPPSGMWSKLGRLITGQGWLHPPQDVARVVEHAISSRRPKTRYLVGVQAKLIYRLRRMLGDRMFDRVLGERVFDF